MKNKLIIYIRDIICIISYLLKIDNRFSDEIKLIRLKNQERFETGSIKLSTYQLDYIDAASLYGQYNEIVKNGIYAFSKKTGPKYIIDCGANIGLSVLDLNKRYPDSEIIAFEPHPTIFRILKKNTREFRNVNCIQSALWNKDGTIQLNSIDSDASSITEDVLGGEKLEVRTESLKKYINKPVDFLKIDIEGAEYEVLIDIKKKLFYVKNIFIEYHCDDLTNKKLGTILQILTDSSFKYYILPEAVPFPPFKHKNIKNNNGYYYQLNIFGFK